LENVTRNALGEIEISCMPFYLRGDDGVLDCLANRSKIDGAVDGCPNQFKSVHLDDGVDSTAAIADAVITAGAALSSDEDLDKRRKSRRESGAGVEDAKA
jgi:hypothetical protein